MISILLSDIVYCVITGNESIIKEIVIVHLNICFDSKNKMIED